MRMEYNGYEVDLNVRKFLMAPNSVKFKMIEEIASDKILNTRRRFMDYWLGYVDVCENHATSFDCNGHRHESIVDLSIITGRKHEGQWFSHISRQICEKLITDWDGKDRKRYLLHISSVEGTYQEYVFNRYQKDILMRKLAESLQEEWYDEAFTD